MKANNLFGMFIHWGLYAELALHEQAMARYGLDPKEYEKLAERFNPTRFDPDEWVRLAKSAGMKYICFTAKHHDGFCMWDTKTTDYSIMHTPYGKDTLAMLADACRRGGIRLSIYYSNPDWHHEAAYNPLSSHQWPHPSPEKANREVYLAYVRAQITELLSNYGEIYSLFWDIPPMFEEPSMNELVRRLQPGILINDRGYDKGDFSTPERKVPDGTRFERMTEACQSVGVQSWGYRADEDYYSISYLTSSIDKVMGMGGSYLLNVGPMADGRINEKASETVARVGRWYARTEGALEGHEPVIDRYEITSDDPYCLFRKNGRVYLHFYKGLSRSAVTFRSIPATPRRARLQNSGEELRIRVGLMTAPFDMETGRASGPSVSIAGIPVDDYAGEPIMLELEF